MMRRARKSAVYSRQYASNEVQDLSNPTQQIRRRARALQIAPDTNEIVGFALRQRAFGHAVEKVRAFHHRIIEFVRRGVPLFLDVVRA
jgi:hypothetical protein